MALNVWQPFKRTSKGQRFDWDVMTKAQMLLWDDTQFEDWYLVVESESHDLYIYDSNATPSAETWKFVKSSWSGGETPTISQVLTAWNNIENQSISWITTTTEPWYTIRQDMSLNKSSYTIHKLQTPEEWLADRWTVDIWVNQIQMSTNKWKTSKSLLRINTSDIENPVVTMSANMKNAWQTALDINGGGIQVTTLPTASATEEWNIYQYVWQTDSNYTNWYFYQCQEITPATDPKTYEWVQKDVQSGGWSLPTWWTTWQALVKKSDADQDVEWADQTVIVGSDWGVVKSGTHTVQMTGGAATAVDVSFGDLGFTSVDDYEILLTSNNQNEVIAVRSKSLTSFNMGVKDVGTSTSQQRTVTVTYTILAKGYGSVPNWWTTWQALVKKSNTDWDVEWKTVSGWWASLTIDTTQVGYWEATISEWWYNLSFTNQNWQWVRIWWISENWEMVTSKSYVDSKSPTIVNEWATFTNAQGNQQMQIRTGGANSVIIKDISANWVSEYWSYELPDKTYVDGKVGVNMEVWAEKWYWTYTQDWVTYQVYSKIVYIPALPSTAGITTYPMGVSNIKQILNIYWYTTDGFILNAPRQNVQDNISIYQVSKGSQTFSIEVWKDRSNKSAYVTIIYAKNN